MSINGKLFDLSLALHRKLLNVSGDIRLYRKKKPRDQDLQEYQLLKVSRKALDQAYSACKNNLHETDPSKVEAVYSACLSTYNKT